jgi:hypothetical protein
MATSILPLGLSVGACRLYPLAYFSPEQHDKVFRGVQLFLLPSKDGLVCPRVSLIGAWRSLLLLHW